MSVSSSSWGLGRAAVCDCGTPWTFLLPFFGIVTVTVFSGGLIQVNGYTRVCLFTCQNSKFSIKRHNSIGKIIQSRHANDRFYIPGPRLAITGIHLDSNVHAYILPESCAGNAVTASGQR